MIKEKDKFGVQIKRESMLKPTVLKKHNPRKMVNGIGYQAKRKRNIKFMKKPMLDKMLNNMSKKNPMKFKLFGSRSKESMLVILRGRMIHMSK